MITNRIAILTWTILFALICIPRNAAADDDEVEFKGTIQAMSGPGVLGTWLVSGRTVVVSSKKRIDDEKGAPAIGAIVKVKGYEDSGIVHAKKIKVEKPAPSAPGDHDSGEDNGDTGGDTGGGGPGGWKLIGWNDLGMHCMDGKDFSVFTTLPPFNTIHCQLIDPNGDRVTSPNGINVTYEAIADPTGSITRTSQGKTNFWDYVEQLFGVALPVDEGLKGARMPGPGNQPQPMNWENTHAWFTGEGIPLSPFDDAGHKNYYPLMKLVARDGSGNVLASTRITLPVSDEMDCRACHSPGSVSAARPNTGWIHDADPEREYKLNILAIHDDRNLGSPAFTSALAASGYNTAGLLPTVQADGQPILCVQCHASNALPGIGTGGAQPLTEAIHGFHAHVNYQGLPLEHADNRQACYSCHPGAETRCLRGAMGAAVDFDGSMSMQCQSCHGAMSKVGATGRAGWFDEPRCQSCHTGTAISNNGQIRFTTVFEPSGDTRQAVNATFATTPNAPAPGVSLYRFSAGHAGLQCSACHGSPHAIYPTSHDNDNLQNIDLQGHAGTLAECTACHPSVPKTVAGGPHGMHPVGQDWVKRHEDEAEHNAAQCRACHGDDYRGTVLSRSLGDRTLKTEFGDKHFWKGFQIGCFACHNGPRDDDRNRNRPAVTVNASIATTADSPRGLQLSATDPDGNPLTFRIVSQPRNGTVGLEGRTATYFPFPGFRGADSFTFAAWDGSTDSNLGEVSVAVE